MQQQLRLGALWSAHFVCWAHEDLLFIISTPADESSPDGISDVDAYLQKQHCMMFLYISSKHILPFRTSQDGIQHPQGTETDEPRDVLKEQSSMFMSI